MPRRMLHCDNANGPGGAPVVREGYSVRDAAAKLHCDNSPPAPSVSPWVGRGIVYSSRVSGRWASAVVITLLVISRGYSVSALPSPQSCFPGAWRPASREALSRRRPVSLRSPVRPPPIALAQPARRPCQVFVPDMIKLFSLKEEKAKEASSGAASNPKIPPGLIRMQKGECRCRRLPMHARC